MTTQTQVQGSIDWQMKHLAKLHYSQSASTRLLYKTDDDLLLPTDCSGLFYKMMMRFCGVNPGTWTGDQINHGTTITTSKADAAAGKSMFIGDGVLLDFENTGRPSHIAMYAGNGKILNHGGPYYNDMGPDLWSLSSNVNSAHRVWVHRYVHIESAPKPKHPWPLKVGQLLGPMEDPSNDVIGGFNAPERPLVKAFQSALCRDMGVKDGSDGTWGKGTTDLLVKWRDKTGHHSATPQYAGEATWRLVMGYTGANT